MKNAEKITLAAIAICMNLPMSSVEIMQVAKSYGVDHREIMTEVNEMMEAERAFITDTEGGEQ